MFTIIGIILKNVVFMLILTFANNVCFVLVARFRQSRKYKNEKIKKLELEILELKKEKQELLVQIHGSNTDNVEKHALEVES